MRHVGVSTSDATVEELLATDADPTPTIHREGSTWGNPIITKTMKGRSTMPPITKAVRPTTLTPEKTTVNQKKMNIIFETMVMALSLAKAPNDDVM